MQKLKVILGSTRNARHGDKVGKLIMSLLKENKSFDAELIDLRDWNLPFFNEVASLPYLAGQYSDEIIKNWTTKIEEADAYVIITPEYNHGYPAVLKNALDYAYAEWKRKPVGFVGYSASQIGGARAVEQLRQVVAELHMADIRDAIYITNVFQAFTEQGDYINLDGLKPTFDNFISELTWWSETLKRGRVTN